MSRPHPAVDDPDIVEVMPELLNKWLEQGDTVLVDVREDYEHVAERIEGAHNLALSTFDPQHVRQTLGDKRIVFHCHSGQRSVEAARRFRHTDEAVFHLAGGIENWKASGFATHRSAAAPRINVMRQVQIAAGTLVVIGVVLGAFVSPWFLLLSGLVGAGLAFAGASGWCGMAALLGRMPWNRPADVVQRQ